MFKLEKRDLKFLFSFPFFFLVVSCGTREVKSGISARYSSISATIVQPRCVECHTSLGTYQGLLEIVKPGNPNRSGFYREINSGDMPQHSPKLSDAEIQAVYNWILNGAAND